MRRLSTIQTGPLCLVVLAIAAGPAFAEPPQAKRAIERGLEFLQQDAVKWRKDHQCATCHHGAMTVWVLSEAKARGFPVPPDTMADTAKWAKERLQRIDLPRDERPGWSMVNTPALYCR